MLCLLRASASCSAFGCVSGDRSPIDGYGRPPSTHFGARLRAFLGCCLLPPFTRALSPLPCSQSRLLMSSRRTRRPAIPATSVCSTFVHLSGYVSPAVAHWRQSAGAVHTLWCVAISVLPPAPFAFVLYQLVPLSPGIGHSCSHARWRGSFAACAVCFCPSGGLSSPPDSARAVLGLSCPLVGCHDAVATVKYVFAFYWPSLFPLLGRPSTPIGRCVSRGVRMVHGVSGERRVGLQPGGSQAVTHRFSHVLCHGPRYVHTAHKCLDYLVLLPF